jgi:hypothetical protein
MIVLWILSLLTIILGAIIILSGPNDNQRIFAKVFVMIFVLLVFVTMLIMGVQRWFIK